MDWFQHSTHSHDDPDISDAWDEFGEFGYVGFFVILEVYGEEYTHRDSEDYIRISSTFLRRKLRKSSINVEQLLNFYSKRGRILSKKQDGFILLKVPKFIERASNWSRRKPTAPPTEAPTIKTPIEKKENRKEDKRIKKSKEQKKKTVPKIKYLDEVYLTEKEHDRLVDDFGETAVADMITKLDNYIGSQGLQNKYKDHNKTLRGWFNRDGIKKREKGEGGESEKVTQGADEYMSRLLSENKKGTEFFHKRIAELREEVNETSWKCWIAPLLFVSEGDDEITLYHKDRSWVQEHYAGFLQDIIGKSVNIVNSEGEM